MNNKTEIKWSPSQQDAIYSKYSESGKSCNILVSAAAGSGKTAVLVQRIIEKLVPQDLSKSIDANKLLVVTFTKAAAHEMLERIKKSLDENLASAKKSGDVLRQQLIKKQQLLILDSEITTIDAFCMRLIRKYFNVLNIAPDFLASDEAQAEILQEEAMDELFSELYKERSDEFCNLLLMYASNRNDTGLRNLIKYIYDFIIKIPDSFDWLFANVEALKLEDGIENAPWYQKSKDIGLSYLSYALSLTEEALNFIFDGGDIDEMILQNPPEDGNPVYDEWRQYYSLFYTYYHTLKTALSLDSEKQANLLSSFVLPTFRGKDILAKEDKDYLISFNDRIKPAVTSAKGLLCIDEERFSELSAKKLYPTALALAKITERFAKKLYEKKSAKNLFEFSDIEQLAYTLLSENPDICQQIKAQYEEVLMDEYQDTSLLQEAIFSFVANEDNLFAVGDMKQSIYRFRSSDPTIFKARLDRSSFDRESNNRKIILSQNFRSRKEVLESINDIFSAIMSERAGELDYDESQRLYTGNKGYQDTGFDFRSECVIIDSDSAGDEKDENLSDITLEARFIASEIARLKEEHFKVHDGDKLRDIKNRDIVILMSSYKKAADIFTAELNARGIECFAEQSGYFSRNEIRLMLALFKVIGNPCSDIPLVSVLRSPIASFSDDELAQIRKCKNGRFFSALKEFINLKNSGLLEVAEDIKTAEKAEKFCENLNRWRDYARYMPSDKLVWTLYEETDFYAFCGAIYGGDEAQANLRLLFERAKQYESYGFRGLFGFVKYMERVKKRKKDLTSAKLIGENHDVVRIMTIHKSKGLEFPVVFIAGGGKGFIRRLDNSKFIMHKDYGITLDYINFEKNYTIVSPLAKFFRNIKNAEEASEDIRVLYVAMTRAKEKLYFVATSGNPKTAKLSNGKLNFDYVLSAKNFCDMVFPIAEKSRNWLVKRLSQDSLKPVLQADVKEQESDENNMPDIKKLLEFTYSYPDAASLAAKVSVSDLKADRTTQIIPKPAFLCGTKISGANYGTIMHILLENILPKENMDIEYIKDCIAEIISAKKLSKEEADLVNPNKILAFYRSDIGRRIIKSENVFREQPFEVLVPISLIYPELKNASDEKIILQGVIDCWFIENDEIVLVDYKTDSYSDIDEIHQKYDRQLDLYSYALHKITGKSIKSKNIYLFSTDIMIEC
ncbi:MAG: helicase-exonuclease AddAB subunit AddA [Firmicutes bacterium]|nr:helicase-exonuclease AddAB subunit AddA [Bacillota bacterium]